MANGQLSREREIEQAASRYDVQVIVRGCSAKVDSRARLRPQNSRGAYIVSNAQSTACNKRNLKITFSIIRMKTKPKSLDRQSDAK